MDQWSALWNGLREGMQRPCTVPAILLVLGWLQICDASFRTNLKVYQISLKYVRCFKSDVVTGLEDGKTDRLIYWKPSLYSSLYNFREQTCVQSIPIKYTQVQEVMNCASRKTTTKITKRKFLLLYTTPLREPVYKVEDVPYPGRFVPTAFPGVLDVVISSSKVWLFRNQSLVVSYPGLVISYPSIFFNLSTGLMSSNPIF